MKKILFTCLTVFLFSALHAQTPDTTLQNFVGKYVFPEGSVIAEAIVSIENGALSVTSSAGVSALVKKGEDLFDITEFQGTAKFNRNATRQVIGVSIEAMGIKLEGTKVVANGLVQLRRTYRDAPLLWSVTR